MITLGRGGKRSVPLNTEEAARMQAWLETIDGVVGLSFRAGDVLVYAGHLANGLYVVIDGDIALYAPNAVPSEVSQQVGHRSTNEGPFMIPPVEELDNPGELTACADTLCHVLFVPRSVLLLQQTVAQRIEALSDRSLSLVEPPAALDQRFN